MKKKTFIGYAPSDWDVVWTFYNTLNIAFVIQKTKTEAYARYHEDDNINKIKKIKITIEEIGE